MNILDPEKRVIFLNISASQLLANANEQLLDYYESHIEEAWSDYFSIHSNSNSVGSGALSNGFRSLTKTPSKSHYSLDTSTTMKIDCKLVVYLVKTILCCGVSSEEVGVITAYTRQKNYIYSKLNVRIMKLS